MQAYVRVAYSLYDTRIQRVVCTLPGRWWLEVAMAMVIDYAHVGLRVKMEVPSVQAVGSYETLHFLAGVAAK